MNSLRATLIGILIGIALVFVVYVGKEYLVPALTVIIHIFVGRFGSVKTAFIIAGGVCAFIGGLLGYSMSKDDWSGRSY